MAARSLKVLAFSRLLKSQQLLRSSIPAAKRFITTNDCGALLERPEKVRFGLIKVTLIVTPFLLAGAQISKEFAAWLEEHELFVPDDDDDD